ncbi:MAG: efflux RND transporter periplasmic adaptor subunit [Kofleriaceae bacterium]|nr:efflux RND transporter periplasmic adaptor subunit [Kofleriaceae bacterium]
MSRLAKNLGTILNVTGIASGLALLVGSSAAGCHSDHQATTGAALPSVAVLTSVARAEAPVLGVAAVGTVRAQERVEIAPTVMGKITELNCTIGAHVKAGDLIARLSVRELSARLAQARESLANASLELDRANKLKNSAAIPGAEYDTVLSRHRIAQAAQAEATTMESYAIVRSPIGGVVTAKSSSTGDMAMPGQPVCVIDDPSTLRFEATIPETLIRYVQPAATLEVKTDILDVAVKATVAEIGPTTDTASRTVLVKLRMPADPRLRVGTFGRVMVPSTAVATITVPSQALVRHGQLVSVFVVSEGKAHLRLVRTGRTLAGAASTAGNGAGSDRIEINAGVQPGDVIVVDHVDTLVDGQPVTTTAVPQ